MVLTVDVIWLKQLVIRCAEVWFGRLVASRRFDVDIFESQSQASSSRQLRKFLELVYYRTKIDGF